MIQQIKERISSWSAKSLSYAGRLQLLRTVIAGITNFWCSSFVLPKACISKINSLCGIYLWSGQLEGHNTARVAWSTVTKHKKEGGLGLKDLVLWNKACILKLIWLLFFRSGSIWVAWYKTEVLKGSINNFWITKQNQKFSWIANKLLKIRKEIFTWIKLRVGSGRECLFWSDNWSPYGSLEEFIQRRNSSHLGIHPHSTLADLHSNGFWRIPPARSDNQLLLQTFLTTIQLSGEDDYYEWEIEGKISDKFDTGQVYKLLKGEEEEVQWAKVVWFSGGIPRHNFLCWLMILNRSPTRDRLLNWGLTTNADCLLCNSELETRNHLFFDCSFGWRVWSICADRCGVVADKNWDNQLQFLQNLSVSRYRKRLILLVWQCSIYTLWSERNSRLHRSTFKSVDVLINSIDLLVRNRIASYRDSRPDISSVMWRLWSANPSVN